MRFADVIIPLAVEGFFTYSLPAALENVVREGALVIVSFAGNKKYTGVVYKIHDVTPENYKVKPLEGLAEEGAWFSPIHLKFLLWVSEYYMALPGEVVKAALPIAFRLESFTCITKVAEEVDEELLSENEKMLLQFLQVGRFVSLKEVEKALQIRNSVPLVKSLLSRGHVRIQETIDDLFKDKTEKWIGWGYEYDDVQLNTILDSLKRAPAQYQMLCRWIERGGVEMPKGQFVGEMGSSPAALKALCDKGVLAVSDRVVSRLSVTGEEGGECYDLSKNQQTALDEIRTLFTAKECALLQGVTSSGKTEVYIHLMKEYIGKGKQVLYMLPEIALTVQIIKRLRRVFGDAIGIYHSGMSDSVRAEMWRKQCSDRPYQLILGVRSSIFLPYTDLGLIIVDEEHENSYKQKEPSPRYNGRDAAIVLGKLYRAKILLGSATPSFETYHNALTGKYGYVRLDSRFGNVLMPQLLIADVKEYRRKKVMKGSFTPPLYEEMKSVLSAGMQIILFQNRRGYSTYLQCDQCGAIPRCPNCDVSLTYYKQRNTLSCRYCGSLHPVNAICTACNTGHYKQRTPGTERIEDEVRELFPESRVARIDADVMSSKSRYSLVIDDFEQGNIDILIGTQMVSKGLDFERVKLVGVLDADSMVHFPDFRAEERAYTMLLQVSGRSGRKGDQGRVVIQTANIEDRVYTFLKEGTYDTFYKMLADERKVFDYPPFGRLILIEIRHKEEIVLRHAANGLAKRLRGILGKRVCGPAVPEIGRINNMYRLQLILKIEHGASYSKIKSFLKNEFALLLADKSFGGVRLFCDVDPL